LTYGNFTNRNNIARLNANGTLDASFNPGIGPNSTVRCIALQPDGKLLLGGSFTHVNGAIRNGFARLNANEALEGMVNWLFVRRDVETFSAFRIKTSARIPMDGRGEQNQSVFKSEARNANQKNS
jgi:hypothetical protein